MEAKLFSVEELAKAAGTSARAVRLYMKKGLLTPQRAGRVYVFTQRDLKTLEHIQRSQRLGLSLKEGLFNHPWVNVVTRTEDEVFNAVF